MSFRINQRFLKKNRANYTNYVDFFGKKAYTIFILMVNMNSFLFDLTVESAFSYERVRNFLTMEALCGASAPAGRSRSLMKLYARRVCP